MCVVVWVVFFLGVCLRFWVGAADVVGMSDDVYSEYVRLTSSGRRRRLSWSDGFLVNDLHDGVVCVFNVYQRLARGVGRES